MKGKFIRLCLLLISILLVGCDNSEESKNSVAIATSQFETETIKLYVESKENMIHITNEREVETILEIVNRVIEYQTVPEQEVTTGMCTKWLVFDKGTTIGIHENVDYGNVEADIQEVGTPLYLPAGLCAYINQIIENHKVIS